MVVSSAELGDSSELGRRVAVNIDRQADAKLIFQFASNELSTANEAEVTFEIKIEKYLKLIDNKKYDREYDIDFLKYIWIITTIFVELGFEYREEKNSHSSSNSQSGG